jgi:hypothetical protein
MSFSMSARSKQRHPALRLIQLGGGVLLIVGAGIVAPLPGPGGIFLFAGGLVLVLRNSRTAQVHFVRLKRRWPRTGALVDRAMRRRSALRRHARDKAARSR